ncbi:aspartic protease, partial [Aphelenchoides avenae]
LGSTTFGTGLVPLLQNAKAQKVIPSHVVTVALIREGVKSPDLPGGTVTYGGVDGKNCDPKVSYVPAWQNDDPTILTMDGVSFGSYQSTDVSWTASIALTST